MGRLLPAGGGQATPLAIGEVVKAAQAKAHRDTSVDMLRQAISGLVKSATSQELEQEKEAFIRPLLAAGRRGAAALAARGGRTGRVGKFLQRDVRSPVQVARSGRTGATVTARSPLAPAKAASPPPVPKDAGGPYRTPGKVTTPVAAPAEKVQDMTRHAKLVKDKPKGVKPKSLTRSLLPGALMIGGAYGLYKGVPAATNFMQQASRAPMAYNFGQQQYQYGYTPNGQAQF